MRIALASVYNEVGTSFHLPHLVVKVLRERLQQLLASTEILEFNEKFRTGDFSVGFIISATRKKETFTVEGPIFMKKPKGIDFIFLIPYKQVPDLNERIDYVLGYVAEGIVQVLRRYNAPDPGITDAVRNVAMFVHQNPKQFE
ncbi:MAG: hypothetical protein ACJ73N_04770 [Bryobacteraceae bacterium]